MNSWHYRNRLATRQNGVKVEQWGNFWIAWWPNGRPMQRQTGTTAFTPLFPWRSGAIAFADSGRAMTPPADRKIDPDDKRKKKRKANA